jgi:Archaeal ATPase.
MSAAQLADEQHPWIGLAPFTESDREFFAGRSEEIDELLRLVRRDTLTLLFGISGLGKTSLLQAGLFPALRAEDYLPVPIRLDYVDGAAPLAQQVLAAITKASDAVSVEAPVPLPCETLWEYFHRESNHFWSPRNDLVTPFLVFDQFEECFTLGRETAERERRGASFISELADLVENRPPAALRGDPQRAREFSFKPRPLKVLLAMREDYLAELDRIRSQFRALGQNRLRLLPMGMPQARQVIDLGAPLMAPGVEDRIVSFVAGSAADADDGEITVAPALLSLVLQQLNERRLEQGADAKITSELLDLQQKKIFEDFYLRTLKPLDPGVRTFIEDRLLTATGFRNSCALDDALSCPGVTQPVLDELVNSRLLAYEDRHRVRRVEITHDVLAPVVRASRDSRISREALAKAEGQKAEAQAKERAARRRFAMVVALLVLAIAMALWGWHEANLATSLLHEASQADVDSAAEISQDDDWAKPLTFLERAARNWLDNPDTAAVLWAQLRHGAASRTSLLRWSKPISENAKLALNPAGNHIATVSPTQPLQLWEAESGTLVPDFENPGLKLSDPTGDVRFSSDGERIILRRSRLRQPNQWSVISMEQRKPIFESEGHKLLKGEPISPNGNQAVSCGVDGLVRIISTLPDQPEIPLVRFPSQGGIVIPGQLEIPIVGFPCQGGIVKWSPKGDRIALSFDPQIATPGVERAPPVSAIHIYDALSGQPLRAAIAVPSPPWENLDFFWFNSSGEYLLVRRYLPWSQYEIWHSDMTEAAPIETKKATFARWFHQSENLLWTTPIERTTRAAFSRTTPKSHSVVHKVGADEKDDITVLLPDFFSDAVISDDDSVSVVIRRVIRPGVSVVIRPRDDYLYYQVFNLKTGQASTSEAKHSLPFTGFLSLNSRSIVLSAKNSTLSRWDLSRWDFGSSQQIWHPPDEKPPREVRANPKWNVRLSSEDSGNLPAEDSGNLPPGDSGNLPPSVSIQFNSTPPRTICPLPLEKQVSSYKWIEDKDGPKLRVSAEDGTYTDIEWDPPEVIEEPILNLVRIVIGQKFDENRKMGGRMATISDEERIKLRNEMAKWQGQVKDPRWRKLLEWWNKGRPGD